MKEQIPGQSETQHNQTEVLDREDEVAIQRVKELEVAIFGWSTSLEDMADLEELMRHPESVTALLRNSEGKVLGYIVGVPSLEVQEELVLEDKEYQGASNQLYIYTEAIAEEARGRGQYRPLFNQLASAAQEQGYTVIAAHIPLDHLGMYEKISKVELLRTIENWFDSGEPHHYIEMHM